MYIERELLEEEKNIKREYGRNRYLNMSEEKKKKLKEYQKNYCNAKIVFYLTFFDFFHFIVLEKRGKKVLSFVKKILSKTNFIYTKHQLVLMKWILKE